MSARLEYVEGDRLDPLSFRIWCSCGAPLGRVGLLTRQRDELRKTICENCGFVLAINDRGQIVMHAQAPAELLAAHGISPLRLSSDVVRNLDMRKLLGDQR